MKYKLKTKQYEMELEITDPKLAQYLEKHQRLMPDRMQKIFEVNLCEIFAELYTSPELDQKMNNLKVDYLEGRIAIIKAHRGLEAKIDPKNKPN